MKVPEDVRELLEVDMARIVLIEESMDLHNSKIDIQFIREKLLSRGVLL